MMDKNFLEYAAYVIKDGKAIPFTLSVAALTDDERQILLDGCLINFYKEH